MRSKLLRKLIGLLRGQGYHTSNTEGAALIRRFVEGNIGPYEWDDFETHIELNPEVDLAIRLCWFFAGRFPSTRATEYCAREADQYFLRVADALERGHLRNLDIDKEKARLAKGQLSRTVAQMLNYMEDNAGGS